MNDKCVRCGKLGDTASILGREYCQVCFLNEKRILALYDFHLSIIR